MRRFGPLVVVAAGLVLVAGCGKKKEGAACSGTEQLCVDPTTALVCRGGKLASVACAGPLKCSKFADHVNCDTSVAAAGAPCMGEDDENACSPDKREALTCKNGRFELTARCRGANGCSMLGRRTTCDASIAAKGDPCVKEGAAACTEDKGQMITCRAGRFEAHRYCRGQLGCVLKPEGPSCDESLSEIGDPCGLSGQIVCATDGKTELICQGGAFMKTRTCKTACKIASGSGRSVLCN